MDLAIRVNVRYAAPPNSQIKDALRLFKSPRWVQSIIRYIIPQLNSVSPVSGSVLESLKRHQVPIKSQKCNCKNEDGHSQQTQPCGCEASKPAQCVICMEAMETTSLELPCKHQFHEHCIEPWLKMHSTCPTCRAQLPTDACTNYSVYAINTTIILQQFQARLPTAELLELSASDQIIRAVVNARVRRRSIPDSSPQATPVSSNEPTLTSAFTDQPYAMTVAQSSPVPLPENLLTTEVIVPSSSEISAGATSVHNVRPPETSLPNAETHEWTITEPIVPTFSRHSSRRRYRDDDEGTPFHKRRRMDEEQHNITV
uniref:Uncharacterized protein AlNc14C134G7041 n=1 Tax=Albugo laibachii Nc14 TaxID=890382 RepID=F0WKI9_9STRA|nr:conserved hypothetical protein [Albugo laibachii Nc14]|eukprot:CCA21795.1 conserved hypothetical protein [Albugo laibachii Nc14]